MNPFQGMCQAFRGFGLLALRQESQFRIPFTNDTLREEAYIGKVTEMYVFAELFEIRKFKFELIDALFTSGKTKPLHQIPSFAVVVLIFENTVSGSGLRRLLAERMLCHAPPARMPEPARLGRIQRTQAWMLNLPSRR
jgi:hypothetical protein